MAVYGVFMGLAAAALAAWLLATFRDTPRRADAGVVLSSSSERD